MWLLHSKKQCMNKQIIIIGGFHEIIELAEELNYKIEGLIDNCRSGSYMNYPVLGTDNDIEMLHRKYVHLHFVVTPDQPLLREKLYILYSAKGFTFTSLISKYAKISKSTVLGIGLIIQSGVNISSEAKIGKFVKLNCNCNIMHNAIIGDFTTIAPNAVILGNVKVGKSCYIGANSTILPNVEICDSTIIGAGAVVTKNVNIPGTYVGNPSKPTLN
jgi:sugar O-acyltransferase (sialic acid O-acetyltransferase NeuD family)